MTKHDFMQCLGGVDRLLIRAKYHSDQLEGTLHTAAMEFGAQGSLSLTRTKVQYFPTSWIKDKTDDNRQFQLTGWTIP